MLERRVRNKPYDVFGAWYNDSYFMSSEYFRAEYNTYDSKIMLNKVSFHSMNKTQRNVSYPWLIAGSKNCADTKWTTGRQLDVVQAG